MKKFLVVGLMVAILSFSVVPALAQVTPGSDTPPVEIGATNVTDVSSFGGLIIKIIRWIYTFIFILAVLFILIAAFDYVTSKGDEKKVESANKNLKNAAIGIAVALLSYAIVAVIKSLINS